MENTYAFFDVDETLLNFKTMYSFYRYLKLATSKNIKLLAEVKCRFVFARMKYIGKLYTREKANIFFYKQFKGISQEEILFFSHAWWVSIRNTNELFHFPVLEKFQEMRRNGVKTVLVSGSLSYCLEPIMNYLKADYLISTQLNSHKGIFTGDILGEPNIGYGKARAIKNFAEKNKLKIDFTNSYAFGDHYSDIPMLKLVGNSYLVTDGVPHKFEETT